MCAGLAGAADCKELTCVDDDDEAKFEEVEETEGTEGATTGSSSWSWIRVIVLNLNWPELVSLPT